MADRPRNPLEEVPRDTTRDLPEPFKLRMDDAKAMYRKGASKKDIIEKHGSVVLRAVMEGWEKIMKVDV